MRGGSAQHAVDQIFARPDPFVGDFAQTCHQRRHILVFRKAFRLHFREDPAFPVRQNRGFIGLRSRFPEQFKLGVQLLRNFPEEYPGVFRIKPGKRGFRIQPVPADPDHSAPLRRHRFAGDGFGPLGYAHLKADRICGQNADVVIAFPQESDQFFQTGSHLVQIG